MLTQSAAHAADGTITGTVTGQGGVPLQSAYVYAYATDYPWSPAASATTDASGGYTLSGLSDGDYILRFVPPYQSRYLGEWYDDKQTQGEATALSVAGDTVIADAELALGVRITGKVTSDKDGQPVSNVSIGVYPANSSSSVSWGYTAYDGTITAPALPPGNYHLRFDPPYESAFLSEWYDNKKDKDSASVVKLTTPGTDVTINAGLALGGQVQGIVTAADDGQPLANVGVLVDSIHGDGYTSAWTDAQGKFITKGLPAGKYRVGYTPHDQQHAREWFDDKHKYNAADPVTIQSGQTTTANAALENASRIVGTVTDPDGAPASGWVYVTSEGDDEWARIAADGSYEVVGLSPGQYTVQFSPDETGELVREWWNNQRDRDLADPIPLGLEETFTADATLERGAVITGTVLDEQNQPVEGVTVRASGADSATTLTDANGQYRLAGLEPGDYRVRFKPLGDLAGQWFDSADEKVNATVLNLAVGQSRSGVDATLRKARTIGGTVTDPDGNPVADVRVEVLTRGSLQTRDVTRTDAQGAFVTHDLPVGSYVVYLRPTSPTTLASQWYDKSQTSAGATPVDIVAGQSTTITAELEPGAQISGQVTGPGGQPLAGIFVSAGRNGEDYRSAHTGPDGRYNITGLTAGDYQVEFLAEGQDYLGEWYDNQESAETANKVTLTPGEQVTGIDAELARAASISGKVLTGLGNPVTYSTVSLYRGDESVTYAWVDGSGEYRFRGLRPGQYTMQAYGNWEWVGQWWHNKPDRASADVIDLAPGADVSGKDFTLTRGGTISGTVTDQDGNPPGQYSYVSAIDEQSGNQRSATIQDGSYTITGLPTGNYRVLFHTNDPNLISEWWNDQPSQQDADPVAVTAGQAVTGINAVLGKASRIRGAVRDGNGKPVRACVTAFFGSSDEEAGVGCTDIDGEYVIGGLRAGTYQVEFDAYSSAFARQWWDQAPRRAMASSIVLGDATEAVADARMLRGGTLTGKVTDEQGEPVGGVQVRAFVSEGHYAAYAVTDGAGRYTMPGLDDETYRLQAVPGSSRLDLVRQWYDNKSDYASADAVPVPSGSTVTADFELVQGASISGVVTDDNGPVAGIGIDVFDLNGNKSATVWTNPQGHYTTTALLPGEYKVRFMPGYHGGHGLVEQWWNDKATHAKANYIYLSAKEHKTGVDAKLRAIGSATAPAAPSEVLVTPGDEQVTVSWKAPANDGGLPVTRYRVSGTPYGGCETLGELTCVVKGLDNGDEFQFTVTARNSAGLSPESAPSAKTIPFGKPQPPKSVKATAGVESATVSWTPGASNGRPITEFTVTSDPGGKTCKSAGTSCTVTGLTGGTPYTFTVKARNQAGDSAPSSPSAAVTPDSRPVAPQPDPTTPPPVSGQTPPPPPAAVPAPAKPAKLKAKPSKRKVRVTWSADPASTRYEVRISPAKGKKKGAWRKTTKPTFTSSKLKKGKYVVEVRTVGAGGTGPSSTKRVTVK